MNFTTKGSFRDEFHYNGRAFVGNFTVQRDLKLLWFVGKFTTVVTGTILLNL